MVLFGFLFARFDSRFLSESFTRGRIAKSGLSFVCELWRMPIPELPLRVWDDTATMCTNVQVPQCPKADLVTGPFFRQRPPQFPTPLIRAETLMTLYQAMKATPDRLPTRRPRWKELGPLGGLHSIAFVEPSRGYGHGSKPLVPFWDRCTNHFFL